MGQRLAIAGAGLAGALIARRLAGSAGTEVTLLEASTVPFGEHTWSFHDTDVAAEDWCWLGDLVACRWTSQSVYFPDRERHLQVGYASLTSDHVRSVLEQTPGVAIRTRARVQSLDATGVTLQTGERIEADCVIDARGFQRHDSLRLGYQKFLGLEVEVLGGHGLDHPVIMDARVEQLGGYRFIYLLPFTPERVLIEDTRYADGPALDVVRIEQDILAYAAGRGWPVGGIVRRESGILPIALAFAAEPFWASRQWDVAAVGMRGALFHPTTGYSLGESVRIANLVAAHWHVGSAVLARKVREHALARARSQSFYRLLSRLLFKAAQPEQRRRILSHFFRLPQPIIERFYAGRTTPADMARIFLGRPPVPIASALPLLGERQFLLETQ